MTIDANVYKEYKTEYLKSTKKVLKNKISTNPEKLKEYEKEIIATHNKILNYDDLHFDTLDHTSKRYYRNELIYLRDKTNKCFGKIGSHIKISNDLLQKLNDTIVSSDSDSDSDSFEVALNDSMSNGISVKSNNTESNTENNNENSNVNNIPEPETATMPMTAAEYLRVAAQIINKNYNGDPLSLKSFLNSIELVKTVDETQVALLKTFVVAKLEGKALECIDQDGTLDQIVEALKKNIKPESSKVISGRMLALKYNKNQSQDFAAQTEKLAEALQRSLIIEGISQNKAKEMVVERTVEVCRQNARSDLVRSVLASTTFGDPKDVIAKLITEQNTADQEKTIFSFHRQNNNFNKNKNYNHYNGNNYHNDNSRGGYHNHNKKRK